MVKEHKPGKMEPNTLVTGGMVWPKEKASSIMLMVMYIPVNFSKIEQMVSAFTFTQTDKNMKVSGKTICKTAQVKKNLKMAANMMECLKTVKNGDKVLINGLTVQSTSVIGLIITSKETESIHGQMEEYIKALGKKTNSTVKEFTTGQTADDTTENMSMIRNMDSEHITGQTEKLMKVIGSMVSSMEKPNLPILKEEAN